jgi:two-component system, cell cycle response regulator DivK
MKTVLVVDDDADTRAIYTTVLSHHGYSVMIAANGDEGVAAATGSGPDVIVMNLSMPRRDGLSAAAQLRGDPRTAAIPIIACTGFVVEDAADRAEEAGCDIYLEKPCEPSRLLQAVEHLIGPPVAAGS